jgi:tetratricopeptide (TPR) repeat protein
MCLFLICAIAVNADDATFKENYDSAVKNLNQKKHSDSLKDIEKALPLASNDAEKFLALACKYQNYNSQRNFVEAANTAGEVLKLEYLTSPMRNQWLYFQIQAYFNDKKFDECIAACDKLIAAKETENKDQGYNYKINSCIQKKDNDKALATAGQYANYIASIKHPLYYRALMFQMSALNNKKEYDKAIAVIAPDEVENIPGGMKIEYYLMLGNNYKAKQKYPEAIAAYEKAANGDRAINGGAAWFALGETYEMMKDDNKALDAFARVYEMYDSNPAHKGNAIVKCAEMLNKNGKAEDALNILKKIELISAAQPESIGKAKILSGKILVLQNKKDEAKKLFEAAANLNGTSPNLRKQAQAELDKIK